MTAQHNGRCSKGNGECQKGMLFAFSIFYVGISDKASSVEARITTPTGPESDAKHKNSKRGVLGVSCMHARAGDVTKGSSISTTCFWR